MVPWMHEQSLKKLCVRLFADVDSKIRIWGVWALNCSSEVFLVHSFLMNGGMDLWLALSLFCRCCSSDQSSHHVWIHGLEFVHEGSFFFQWQMFCCYLFATVFLDLAYVNIIVHKFFYWIVHAIFLYCRFASCYVIMYIIVQYYSLVKYCKTHEIGST